MSNEIVIEIYDKADVLRVLYNNSRPLGMGILHFQPEDMTKEEATELLEKTTYFDYVKGRVMKINLAGDTLNTWAYDRDNGDGAAARAIDSLTTPAPLPVKHKRRPMRPY